MDKLDAAFWSVDGEDPEHVHGDHWGAFAPDATEFFKQTLPLAIQQGSTLGCKPEPRPDGEPRGMLLRYPIGDGDFISLIELREAQNLLASAWPHVAGTGHRILTLRKGFLWPNRLEAQVEADFGPSTVTFFDHRFLEHGSRYREGFTAEFHLAIHAYTIEKPDPAPIVVDKPEAIRRLAPDRDPDDLSPLEFHTQGMAAFFQLKSSDRDDCEFRGPVRSVRELASGAFGGRAWILTVTVLRDTQAEPEDEDINMDVVISEKVLGTQALPRVGEDIQGAGWVQGWLADAV
jgi:hypothetical protein